MATTVRTKPAKKQPPIPHALADAAHSKRVEHALMELEEAVFYAQNAERDGRFMDVDFLYWQRQLNNIAAQVSLALAECGGPRAFHQHYRHDPKDYEHLEPTAGPAPLITLARVCREALAQCVEMVGLQDDAVLYARSRLEQALRGFLTLANGTAGH